ncbi:MAG: SOS response-associated peptidase [Bacteroidetes bacterium]|nr:SOS response-associated peptidase [Bacteroidota bacterium]
MCYNVSNKTESDKQLEKRLKATYPKKLPQWKPIYSVSGFLHPALPIVTADKPDEISLYNWGLIPGWTPSEELAKQFRANNLNAKSETIFEKRSFSAPIKSKRCLVPVTGFFEWREVNKQKYPYHIHAGKEEIFCLGGIYDEWVNKQTGELINSFSIITTEANPLMAKIHNNKLRMPFIVPPEKEEQWLTTTIKEEELKQLMLPFDENEMQAYTISKRITSRLDNPNAEETILPFSYPELEMYDAFE